MPRPVVHALLCASLVLLGMCASERAFASPLLDVTGDHTGIGGLQAGVVPSGSAASYFNPALLVDTPSALTLGVVVLSEQIGVTLDGRPGPQYAVPTGLENAGHADGTRWDNYPIATSVLQQGRAKDAIHDALMARPRQGAGNGHETFRYEAIGLVAKLFHDRLALGFHGLVPNQAFTNLQAFYSDEREQYFSNSLHPELYADRFSALSMAFAAGVRLHPQLSIGAGGTLSLRTAVSAPAYVVDAGKLQDILINPDAQVLMSLSPHVGVAYTPTSRLRFTATAHAPERVELDTKFTFLLANGVQQASALTFVYDYTPWQLGVGASFAVLDEPAQTLTVVASCVYAAWSGYLDRHDQHPTSAYRWADTLSPTLGARYQHGVFGAFVDTTYQPTPVPAQTGRTNYVDNDRIAGSVGGDFSFVLLGSAMTLGAQLQAHRLLPRHQEKLATPVQPDGRDHFPQLVKDEVPDDSQISGQPVAGVSGLQTNNPGWPGFGSAGLLLGGGVYLSVKL